MNRYKVTVEVADDSKENYRAYNTVYEQIVEGDDTLVNGIVQTVLDYNSLLLSVFMSEEVEKSKPSFMQKGGLIPYETIAGKSYVRLDWLTDQLTNTESKDDPLHQL